jgi:carboxylesterase
MLAFILAALLITIVATVALVKRAALRLRDEATRRLPVGLDGIVLGAEAFELRHDADAPSVLLLHGAGDTPQTLRYLAEFLHQRGYNARVPLLPGHGRSVREFSTVDANDWLSAARTAYRDLAAENDWVAVVGLSMGGALAARLAAEDRSLPCLVLLAPYLAMPRRIAIAARLSTIWSPAVPFVRALDPKARRSIQDNVEASRSLAYGVFTPAALRALYRTVDAAAWALPRIASPTLMIQSREDNRVPPAAAQHAFDRIGSTMKQLVWLAGTGHVITVDFGRERVFELVAGWLDRHQSARIRERRA